MHHNGSEPLPDDDAEGVAHPEDGGGEGALAVREPVLGYLGGDAGDEGAGDAGQGLSHQRHPVLNVLWDVDGQARECAHATHHPAQARQHRPDPDAGLEAAGLHEVGGEQAGWDPGGVAHGRDHVQLVAGDLVVGGRLLSDRGEGDPVGVVGQIQ